MDHQQQASKDAAKPTKNQDVDMVMPWVKGFIGAAIGGVIGWFAYFFLLNNGLDGLAIPGAAVGLGFGLMSKRASLIAGFVCAVIGLGLMLCCEWKSLVAFQDKPFTEFMSNIGNLNNSSKIMMGIGTVMAFWFGRGR